MRWSPTIEQAQQAAAMASWFLEHLPTAYGFEEKHHREPFCLPRPASSLRSFRDGRPDPRDPLRAALRPLLEQAFPARILDAALPAFLCFPEATGLLEQSTSQRGAWASSALTCAVEFALDHLRRNPTAGAVRLVGERLAHMLMHPLEHTERPFDEHQLKAAYCLPRVDDCITLLLAWQQRADARLLLRAMVTGAWRVPTGFAAKTHQWSASNSYQFYIGRFGCPDEYWSVLDADDGFDYATFCQMTEVFDDGRPWLSHRLRRPARPDADRSERRGCAFTREYRRRLAADIDKARAVDWDGLVGIEWLLAACGHIERGGAAVVEATCDRPAHTLRTMADISGFDDGEDAVAVAQLRAFSPRTLKAVLPHLHWASRYVLRALDWTTAEPLDAFVRETAWRRFDSRWDLPNCADPECGVVDRRQVLEVVAAAGEGIAREYFAVMRAAKVEMSHTLMLVEAVMGWNAAAIDKGLRKQQQVAVKALGLLPLSRGEEEAVERYERIKAIEKASRGYGPDRRLNTKAAVDAALSNLAAVAGYADRVRLEWALEARRASAESLLGARTIGDYDVELTVGDTAMVTVSRNGKRLKAAPPALKRDEAFAEIAEFVKDYALHATRMRQSLEALMVAGDELSARDLAAISGMPAAAGLLRRLVLRDARGTFGFRDFANGGGESFAGAPWTPLAPVCIVHPFHLQAAGQLAAAQRAIVRRRVVQPFKQVFRELYLLPAAEREASASTRFAGTQVDTKRAARLFESRRWRIRRSDVPVPEKRLDDSLDVAFDFPDARHHLSEVETVTADGVWFARAGTRIRLGEVPPVLFSEAMRDADLVVSAAAWAGVGAWSAEAAERRAQVALEICAEFRVLNVAFEGNFAQVDGARSRYRIHLGSGVVHREPGAQVVVVPPGAATAGQAVFLPFPPDEDVRTAEIIGLVLLFANDARIGDPALLAQIA